MKKLISTIFAFVAIALMTVLSSCGGAPSNEDAGKIINKFESGDKLSESDYGTLISYISAAVDDIAPINKEIQEVAEKMGYPECPSKAIIETFGMINLDDINDANNTLDSNGIDPGIKTMLECLQKLEKVGEKYEYLKQAQQIVKYSGTYMGEPNHDKVMELRERIEKENIDAPFLFI